MRIAELSRASGVPIPSIKYYLRSGLLPPGERTAPNQADYSPAHIRRLRLIRALIDVGGLSVAATAELLETLDSRATDRSKELGMALMAAMPKPAGDRAATPTARDQALRIIDERGWRAEPDSPLVDNLAAALSALSTLGTTDVATLIDLYAGTAEELGRQEVEWVAARGDRDTVLQGAIVGTFIGATVLNAMRMIVHQTVSEQLLATTDPDEPAT